MIKAYRYTSFAAAALILATACTKENIGSSYLDDPDAVRISAQVGEGAGNGSFATRSNPVGNAGAETSFNDGDKVCVTADGQPEVVYAYDGSSWTPEEDNFLKWNSSTMDFTAWYPAAEGVDFDNFNVPSDQSEKDKIAAADYMTVSQQISRDGDNPVSLSFQRRMARIEVVPTFKNQFNTDEYSITEVSVCGNTKGYASGSPVSGNVEVKAYNNGTFYALLSPTTVSSETFIKVKVEKNDGSEVYSLEAKGIIDTQAGKSYTVNLTVGKEVASVAGVTVKPWTSGGSITGGEADENPYLTFSAENEQTFTMNFQPPYKYTAFSLGEGEYFEYSVGGGKWTRFTSTISDENAVAFGGAKGNLRLRGKSSKGTADDYTICSTISFTTSDSPVRCTGDIRTLIDYENYASANTENARFCYLFCECTALTTAPELPATTLADYCYFGMFAGCSSLTQAPQLPAQTLKDRCYAFMFDGCSSLTTAPVLSAMTLDEFCYSSMFQRCTSLTTPPALPATELKPACYYGMFQGCTSLKIAPVLHATTLVRGCYLKIFDICPVLENVTMLATGGFETSQCLETWLGYYKEYGDGYVEDRRAGKYASTRTLTLANEDVYNQLVAKESTDEKTWITDCWKNIADGATIILLDGSTIE